MTEVTSLADASATTAIVQDAPKEALVQTVTEATPPAEAKPEDEQVTDNKPEQPRGTDGKFLPNHPRVAKLQDTINDLTRKKHDAARELDRLRSEAETLRKDLQTKPEIDPADFSAQNTYEIKRAIKEQRFEDTVQRIDGLRQATQQTSEQILSAQVEAMREHIPDIEKVYLSPAQGGPPMTPVMMEVLSRQENGALVAYHLANKPQLAQRIYNSDPLTVAMELGKLAAEVKPAPVKRVSQAPQPVQTVSGAPGNPAPALESLPFSDYERVMNEREMARRR